MWRSYFVLTSVALLLTAVNCIKPPPRIGLGVVFKQGNPEVQSAFKLALMQINDRGNRSYGLKYGFNAYADRINTADAYKLSKLICNQFVRRVYLMVGSMNADSFQTFHSYANTFHMPILTPLYPSRISASLKFRKAVDKTSEHNGGSNNTSNFSGSQTHNSPFIRVLEHTGYYENNEQIDYVTRIQPQLHMALIDTVDYYGWKEIIYLYSTDEGLSRLQAVFQNLKFTNDSVKIRSSRKIQDAKDALSFLRTLEHEDRWSKKFVVLDCPSTLAKNIVISHARDLHMGRRTYHYLIAGLAFDEPWEENVIEYSAINITGFRMVNPNRPVVKEFYKEWVKLDAIQFEGAGKKSISANAALMYDGMLAVEKAFSDLLKDRPLALQESAESLKHLSCDTGLDFLDEVQPFQYGHTVNRYLRQVEVEGLTGLVKFHKENGTRYNFTIDVMEMTKESKVEKIAVWSDILGLKAGSLRFGEFNIANSKKVYVVTTILEEPFVILKRADPGEVLKGNDRFEGFCKDLAELITKNLNIQYELTIVKDGRYGYEDPSSEGGWDGMIGELVRHEADMSISPLTITAERERVVDFTKPFMSLGISIMFYKPKKANTGVFGFMSPLSTNTWICVVLAYLGVSLVLYITTRFNPTEWTMENQGTFQNQFSIPNSLWFSFAALVQQGSDLTPRSLAGRIVGSVWWFFTLILISSYTANFAAVRTVNKMVLPIKSAKDLSEQSEIAYGTLLGGSTYDFFRRSEVPVYKAMFEYMSGPHQINVKTYEDGIKLVREMKGKYALLIESAKNDYTNQRKPCDTMKIGNNLDSKGFGIGTPLGSPLKHRLNLEVLKLTENGILSHLENKWWNERSECDISEQQETASGDEQLSLGSLAGIFYILIIGLVLAMLVSFLEFCYNSRKTAKKSKVTLAEAMKMKARDTIAGPEVSSPHHSRQAGHHHHHPEPQGSIDTEGVLDTNPGTDAMQYHRRR